MPRLFMLGIDGLPPLTLHRFADEGILPHCSSLIRQAAELAVVPTLPALTSPGWLTIGSGALPGTLGVSNILLPTEGSSPDTIRNGFDRSLTDVEYLWEALVAEGRPATVLKYPGSWPPRPADGLVQVDGAGGYADITCRFEELASATYLCGLPMPAPSADGCCLPPRGYEAHWRIDSGAGAGLVPFTPREPVNWTGLPADFSSAFEGVLSARPAGQRRAVVLHMLAGTRAGRPVALIAPKKAYRDVIAELAVGDWSDWIVRESVRGRFAFRLKLLELDPGGGRLRLYRSEGHRLDGFTVPEHVAGELVAAAGPVVEWTGTYDYMSGLVDLDTQLEIYDQHTAWLERAIRHLAARDWDGFFVHWHVVEYAHHIAGAALDRTHPRHAVHQQRFLDFLRDTYRLLDRLVHTVQEVVETEDALALVSDHGHDVVHSFFYLNDFLREQGWLATCDLGDHQEIDWSESRAYGLFPGLVLLNRGTRWPQGTVAEDDVDALRADITTALRRLTDPRTGSPVVTAVLDPVEMAAFGQFGPSAPDLFFTMDRGYEPATRLRRAGAPVFKLTEPGSELTSGHGSFHPASSSATTLALLRHPSLRPGARGRYPVPISDLAPTFAALLGVRAPRQCDGRPVNIAALGLQP
jgi:predicted AlkP superfamily phosphohydrolase/phosphomutase